MAEAEFLTIKQVRELVPGRHGGKLSRDTVFRWINQGDRSVTAGEGIWGPADGGKVDPALLRACSSRIT